MKNDKKNNHPLIPLFVIRHSLFVSHGQTLLFSLLILGSVAALSVGFATLIINEIKSSENIDQSIQAFYAAESGLEKGLYVANYGTDGRKTSGEDLGKTVNGLKGFTKQLNNGASVKTTSVSSTEQSQKFFLAKDESRQVDLYDPDNPFAGLGADKLTISWKPSQQSNEWMEISLTEWTPSKTFQNISKNLISPVDLPYTMNLININNYQIRFKALYNKIDEVEVKVWNGTTQVFIPSRLSVTMVGEYGRTQQAASISMPWRYPTSGLFDYVVFVNETLKKVPSAP